jgi:VanZ family protein
MVVPAPIRFALALLYLSFISFLFFLPGSALPKNALLSKIYFDKWVHIGFFGGLLLLWCWAVLPSKRGFLWLLASAAAYGILVEIIQDQFVANRSFDIGDWLADMMGAVIALWLWKRYIKK